MVLLRYTYTYKQARIQGRFEGVRKNPLCSLAKVIFNETAAVCSGIVTDGIQAIMQLLQGVVTYTSPVEAFATGIKNFDRLKIVLDRLIAPFRGSVSLDYTTKAL